MIYGYCRTSSKSQLDNNSFEAQEQELRKQGATEILFENFTGTKRHRPILDELIDKLQPGDTVIVAKLDRIARNAKDGIDIIDTILEKGCSIRILNMGLFDSSPSGKLMRTVMFAFAEFERDMIVERTKSGREIARQNPNYRDGRPKKFTPAQIKLGLELLEQGKTYREVERMTGISESTMLRAKRESLKLKIQEEGDETK